MYFESDVLNKFKIGEIVINNNTHNPPLSPRIAWITGLQLNCTDEVIFTVRYADKPEIEVGIHPSNISKLP